VGADERRVTEVQVFSGSQPASPNHGD
jgi:hypothetical protein